MLTLLLLLFDFCSCFRILDMEDMDFVLRPSEDFCRGAEAVIVVHSAPNHRELRQTIRETWGGVDGYKTVFVLGLTGLDVEKEFHQWGDLVQGNVVDAYRNMTYKHLLGYM